MQSLIEQIQAGALWDFPGGIHPLENKTQSNVCTPVEAGLPQELVLPIKQHIGKAGRVIVNVGDKVLRGQPLTEGDSGFMLPVHAPTSGIVTGIEHRTVAHPSGLTEPCIMIAPDGEDNWQRLAVCEDFRKDSPEELTEKLRQAGISGMGGAGFPTSKKIQSGFAKTEILIVNAAECEPYITADDVLMQHYASEIITGIEILQHILEPKLVVIGIEDNKPAAIKALQTAAKNLPIVIRVIPTKYPSGGEKQLIKILTNLEVPAKKIPADIGVLVQNVGTLYAIKRAILNGESHTERLVTLTGNTFEQPRNVWVKFGTPIQSLLDDFGYSADKKLQRIILGGPMMGFTLPHTQVPVTKTTNCILAPSYREIDAGRNEMACIRCGECAAVCPASLLPQQLQWHAKAEEFDKCEELNLKDCIECGACAYVCPSEIPLVQYYRQAKAEIRTRNEEAEAAERAKQRFEEKKARMERDKQERENRFKKAAEKRKVEAGKAGDDAIAAAIERVKAQKAQAEKPAVKPAVAAAIAKAKAQQAASQQSGSSEPDNTEMKKLREERKRLARERKAEKTSPTADSSHADSNTTETKSSQKDAVAAAITRAKAKKQATNSVNTETKPQPEQSAEQADSKKAAVAAAIARAKAKKQEASQPAEKLDSNEDKTDKVASSEAVDPKKAAVAAAIARAKAKKQSASQPAEKLDSNENKADEVLSSEAVDPKKAAVAAAIARAKAKKQSAIQPAEKRDNDEDKTDEVASSEVVDPKKAAVAAAIARAKAKKQAASQSAETLDSIEDKTDEVVSSEPIDPKKAAVAAAIARAKAKKQAASQSAEKLDSNEDKTDEVAASDTVDPKKAAVAAAIARAKAKKQAASQSAEKLDNSGNKTDEVVSTEPIDPKKAAVAAAIARAKAKKQQRENPQNSEDNN